MVHDDVVDAIPVQIGAQGGRGIDRGAKGAGLRNVPLQARLQQGGHAGR